MNLTDQKNKSAIRNLKRGCETPESYAYAYSFTRPKTIYKDEYDDYRKKYTSWNEKSEVSCVGSKFHKLI